MSEVHDILLYTWHTAPAAAPAAAAQVCKIPQQIEGTTNKLQFNTDDLKVQSIQYLANENVWKILDDFILKTTFMIIKQS